MAYFSYMKNDLGLQGILVENGPLTCAIISLKRGVAD